VDVYTVTQKLSIYQNIQDILGQSVFMFCNEHEINGKKRELLQFNALVDKDEEKLHK